MPDNVAKSWRKRNFHMKSRRTQFNTEEISHGHFPSPYLIVLLFQLHLTSICNKIHLMTNFRVHALT